MPHFQSDESAGVSECLSLVTLAYQHAGLNIRTRSYYYLATGEWNYPQNAWSFHTRDPFTAGTKPRLQAKPGTDGERRRFRFKERTTTAGPIPFRISLSSWNVLEPFDEWLAREIHERHQIRHKSAMQLVRGGLILPLLDGLDEMDPRVWTKRDDSPGVADSGANPRAAYPGRAARLRSLRQATIVGEPAPKVLACRSEVYSSLIRDRRRDHPS
ncbi:MAG: hypothetical protein WBA31_04045 [Candidatus Dormiibacterota bacterium]